MSDQPKANPPPASNAWQAHNLSQLIYFGSLSLREKFEAVEGMADIVRRLEQMRSAEKKRDR